MTAAIIFGTLIVFSIAQLLRLTLILTGRWKGPILAQFSTYAPDEVIFDPLPMLAAWSGTLLMSIGLLLTLVFQIEAWIYLPGALIILVAYLLSRRQIDIDRPSILRLPVWYIALKAYSTREERRHIAYMWLRLPEGTRARFNNDDRAFMAWAELIVLSTIQQTVYDPRMESALQSRVYRPI